MAIEKFIVQIVSELDETGFKKLDELQSNADKSAKNLSNSLKDLFNIKGLTGLNIHFGEIANDAEMLKETLNSFIPFETDNGEKRPNSGEQFVPPIDKKNFFPENGLSSLFSVRILNYLSSGLRNFFASFFNCESGGFFLRKTDQAFIPQKKDVLVNNKLSAYKDVINRHETTSLAAYANNSSAFQKEIANITYPELNNFSALSLTSTRGFEPEIKLLQNFLTDGEGAVREMLSVENISNTEILSPEPVIPEYSTTTVNNSASSDTSSIDGITLNIEQGAIQINTTSDEPQQIGEAVKAALTDALDDFILKRGYTKAV